MCIYFLLWQGEINFYFVKSLFSKCYIVIHGIRANCTRCLSCNLLQFCIINGCVTGRMVCIIILYIITGAVAPERIDLEIRRKIISDDYSMYSSRGMPRCILFRYFYETNFGKVKKKKKELPPAPKSTYYNNIYRYDRHKSRRRLPSEVMRALRCVGPLVARFIAHAAAGYLFFPTIYNM